MSSHGTIDARVSTQGARREDWLTDGLVSGFVATFAMTVVLAAAYGISSALGRDGGTTVSQWFWNLTHNVITQRTADQVTLAIGVHLATGLVLAIIYAYVVEPVLSGPGWRRGVLFSLIPWLFSLFVVLPIVGGGVLGMSLGAGPLPIVGNLVLHLVYGAALGGMYAVTLDHGLEDTEIERRNAAKAERGAAIGVVVGLALGVIGGWLLGPTLAGDLGRGAVLLAGALIGAAGGLAAGSFLGMGTAGNPSR